MIEEKKYDFFNRKTQIVEKTKKKLIKYSKEKQFMVRGHYSKDELHKLVVEYDIPLTYQVDVIEPGWLGKPKDL